MTATESTQNDIWTTASSDGFPVQSLVGLRMARALTDHLDNIDAFVEEHGIESVRLYLDHKFPTCNEVDGTAITRNDDGTYNVPGDVWNHVLNMLTRCRAALVVAATGGTPEDSAETVRERARKALAGIEDATKGDDRG